MKENLISSGSISLSTNEEKSDISSGEEINSNNKTEIIRNKAIINEINEILKTAKGSKKKEEMVSEELMNYIKQNNINIFEIKDNDNSTIIQIYCANKEDYNLHVILLCLDKLYPNKEDINQYLLNEDASKMNIFDTSCEIGDIKIFRLLRKYLKNNQKILNHLINNGNDGKRNIFHIAADKNKSISLLYFYSFYFNNYNNSILNLKNKSTWTPLHIACYRGNYEFVQYLVSLGVDIDVRDSDKKSPLFYAVQSNSTKIVKFLILNGANKKIKDNKEKTAIEYTKDENIYDILENKNIFRIACKCEIQYQSLKKHYRNIFMLILLLFLIIIHSFIIIRYKYNDFIQKNYDGMDTSLELTFLIMDIIFEILGIFIYILFQFLKKYKKKSSYYNVDINNFCIKENGVEYYEMFRYNENICVKCQRVKEMNTQHCIACDMCIDNFDHHCYFLNSCIYSGNKIYFRMFLVEGLLTVFMNLLTSIIFFNDFRKYHRIYYGIIYNEKQNESSNEINIFDIVIYCLNIFYFCNYYTIYI